MTQQIKHPLPWRFNSFKNDTEDARGNTIINTIAAANSLQPYLLIPKDIREYPQPEREGTDTLYVIYYRSGSVGLCTNDRPWVGDVVAWAGPLPAHEVDAFEEVWMESHPVNPLNFVEKEQARHFYDAGRKAAK